MQRWNPAVLFSSPCHSSLFPLPSHSIVCVKDSTTSFLMFLLVGVGNIGQISKKHVLSNTVASLSLMKFLHTTKYRGGESKKGLWKSCPIEKQRFTSLWKLESLNEVLIYEETYPLNVQIIGSKKILKCHLRQQEKCHLQMKSTLYYYRSVMLHCLFGLPISYGMTVATLCGLPSCTPCNGLLSFCKPVKGVWFFLKYFSLFTN